MNVFVVQVPLHYSAFWGQILMVALVFPIPAPKSPQLKECRPCFCQRWQESRDITFYGSWQPFWNSSAWRHMQRGYRWRSSCGEAAWDPGWALQHMAALYTMHSQHSHQHAANSSAACPWLWCFLETTSMPPLYASLRKKIPTFIHVQERSIPNFAWSWISVTVQIFILLFGPFGLCTYPPCCLPLSAKASFFSQYRKSFLVPGRLPCLYWLHTVIWKNVLARNQFGYWWHSMSS